ncbi:DNA-binding protein [Parabacteroides faecis]|uniref:HU family DNA-binding protein n=1 Tax=Parabacteroides faecis TaxID=1217282 RepID=UPI002164A1CF|nr:HU family DNA-binding protein [Parabacteroides faecis]MCS2892717.1 DNA-binding protein [Parabacteroides faecis]UVQ48662.1 DNA-binding protein [Parabacteroides faecis]
MAMKFKLVLRKNMGPDQEEVPMKVYAQMVCGDYVPFEEFVEEIADSSGVGSAGVKAVIDRSVVILVRHLQHGRRVHFGDLGHFCYNFGSEGVTDEKSFTTSMIREPKVRFFPGKELRVAKSRTSFEKVSLDKKDEGEGGGEGDRPEIE